MFTNPWHCRAVDICQFVFGLCPLGVYPWGDRSGALQALHPHHFPFFPLCRGPVLFQQAVCCQRLLSLGFCWFHQRSVLSQQQASRPPARCSPLVIFILPIIHGFQEGKRQFVLILSSHSSLIWTWQRNFASLNGLANPRLGCSYLSLPSYFVASNYVGALVLVLLTYQLCWCDILFSMAQ